MCFGKQVIKEARHTAFSGGRSRARTQGQVCRRAQGASSTVLKGLLRAMGRMRLPQVKTLGCKRCVFMRFTSSRFSGQRWKGKELIMEPQRRKDASEIAQQLHAIVESKSSAPLGRTVPPPEKEGNASKCIKMA